MASQHGLATTGLGRLHSMQALLWKASEDLGTESPDAVLKNFLEIMKTAGPVLNAVTTLFVPWAMLVTALYKYDWILRTWRSARDYVDSLLYASVSIPGQHEIYSKVLRWVAEQGLQGNLRTLALPHPKDDPDANSANSPPPPIGIPGAMPHDDEVDVKQLSYVPAMGQYNFNFAGKSFCFERRRGGAHDGGPKIYVDGPYGHRNENEDEIILSCFSPFSGVRPLQDFLFHVSQAAAAARENKTTIYRATRDGYNWDHGISRPARGLSAVELNAGVKEAIVQDVESYLHEKTRKYYSNRGIPWRRGYLFYGPPGTGKTSFTTALAGHFKLKVYLISLSSLTMSDNKLDSLFERLPARCIVLLEDIDSAGIRREVVKRPAKTRPVHMQPFDPYGNPIDDDSDGVTLSGLLNVLDGVHAAEGRIVIMTSNNPDDLDEALVRRGRIDQKILFGYASRTVTAKLFKSIFCKTTDELLEGEQEYGDSEIDELSETFANSFTEQNFTPAEIQGYLIDNRTDPRLAAREAAAYFTGLQKVKIAGINVPKTLSSSSSYSDIVIDGSATVEDVLRVTG